MLLFGTMASITNFIASATGFLRMSDFLSHKVDLVMVILGFIGYLALFIFFAIKIELFRFTFLSFKKIQYVYVYFAIWIIIVLAYILGPLILTPNIFALVCIPCALAIAYAFILRPFNNFEENIRYCVNITLLSAIIVMRTFAEYHFSYDNTTYPVYLLIVLTNVFLIPIVQILNIAIGVLYVRRHCFNRNVECVCGAELQPNECFECIEKK